MSCTDKATDNTSYKYAYLYENLPFEMPYIHVPVFPDNQVSVADFGGNPNGIALNTEAFEKAMEVLSQKGGGTLIVPKGVWFTGPIVFRSNINMHLEKGALILSHPILTCIPWWKPYSRDWTRAVASRPFQEELREHRHHR